jgi:hypothetical protein
MVFKSDPTINQIYSKLDKMMKWIKGEMNYGRENGVVTEVPRAKPRHFVSWRVRGVGNGGKINEILLDIVNIIK